MAYLKIWSFLVYLLLKLGGSDSEQKTNSGEIEYIENYCGKTIKLKTAHTIRLSKDLFYPTGWTCETTLLAPRDHVIWITFSYFDVGRPSIVYCTDVLRIYDGDDAKAPELSPNKGFCGKTLPRPVTSTDNKLTFRFRSHVVTTSTGFTLTATVQRELPEYTPCWRREFACRNFVCIDKSLVCDGQINCREGEDESKSYAGCEGLLARWSEIPFAAKIGIIVGVLSLIPLSICFVLVCCCSPKMRYKKLRD